MASKKNLLSKAKIYLVLDRQVCGYERLFDILKEAVKSGAGIVQIRDKMGSAKEILDFSQRALKYLKGRALFIINDRVDLALLSGADGVHLGQNDLPVAFAKRMLGPKKIIGVSCQTLEQVLKAQEEGADYIGFGSVFKTKTKPGRKPMDLELLVSVISAAKIPVFPIGGIGLRNIRVLTNVGVDKIAVTRSICLSKNIHASLNKMLSKL